MAKGKKQKAEAPTENKDEECTTEKSVSEIFKLGMNFENTIEYIESKVLDAFFGHISRQGEWDLAKQYISNVQEWCQMLQTTANFDLNFLSKSLQETIVKSCKNLELGIQNLLEVISLKDFDKANESLEKILKNIRELYRLRE
ncbi:MAG TPA: hypothetical protein VMV49_05815 [Candidatus Deferrimicrobium sp.]|nr:hypothetical protein [Candidatus Deferrimicrobium sp.]